MTVIAATSATLVGNSTPSRQPKVVVHRVDKIFPLPDQSGYVNALKNVNLTVHDGEFVSLLGPSGCGKSTLLEIVAGLQAATRGEVRVDGEVVTGPGAERTVMFQHYALFPWRTALENVAFPMEVAKVAIRERYERAQDYLRIVGLESAAERYPSQLSGGMQQRVALARALACEPKVLLMDEPFSGADAITREMLQDHLLDVQRKTAKTILFVTHSVDEAIRLSDRIVVLGTKPGRVVQEFSVERPGAEETFIDREERLLELKDTLRVLLRKIMTDDGSHAQNVPLSQ
jgi:NitT/TauT family transport system ATP-binding protein